MLLSPLWWRRFWELDHLVGRPRAGLDLVGAVIDLVADIAQEISHHIGRFSQMDLEDASAISGFFF
jgi:hypothetical protein